MKAFLQMPVRFGRGDRIPAMAGRRVASSSRVAMPSLVRKNSNDAAEGVCEGSYRLSESRF